MARGFLVTCEGIDGSGKSTACRALVDALRERGVDARAHAEPTRTWLGEAVRRGFTEDIDAWSETLLFMADHATHVRQVRREMAEGAVVVSDRWSDSTFAYQGAALHDSIAGSQGIDAVATLQQIERAFDLPPDLTLLFDIDPKLAMQRVAARAGEREKFEREEFLAKVRANYQRLAKEDPARFVIIDASRSERAILADALAAVLARTSPKQS